MSDVDILVREKLAALMKESLMEKDTEEVAMIVIENTYCGECPCFDKDNIRCSSEVGDDNCDTALIRYYTQEAIKEMEKEGS